MTLRRLICAAALICALCGAVAVQAQDSISAAVQPFVDRGLFPGLISVTADKDGHLTVEAVGWSDIESAEPMTMDSVFWIASMTKGVVGAGLLILVDEGLFDLDAHVET